MTPSWHPPAGYLAIPADCFYQEAYTGIPSGGQNQADGTPPGKSKTYPRNQKTTQKKIGKTAQAILDELVADPHLTRTRLAELVGKSEDTVKLHLSSLQARGILQHIGPNKGGYWKVLIRN